MHAHMDHRIGFEALLQPRVESGVLMMWCESSIEQQLHRIARHTHRWLHAEQHIAIFQSVESQRIATRRCDIARCSAPIAIDTIGGFAADQTAVLRAGQCVRALALGECFELDE